MAGRRLDLSHLDTVDLQALRLGAQVMVHKAELAARPRVELFFRGLQLTVDEEIGRRRRAAEEALAPMRGSPHAQPPLAEPEEIAGAASAAAAVATAEPSAGAGAGPGGTGAAGERPGAGLSPGAADDRRLTADYLDLLAANPRLSAAVRQTFRTLRDGLRPDA